MSWWKTGSAILVTWIAICPLDTTYNGTNDGIFKWPKSVLRKLKKKSNGMEAQMMADQLELIDYLLEHCSELCLDPSKDISTNPGWEKYLLFS